MHPESIRFKESVLPHRAGWFQSGSVGFSWFQLVSVGFSWFQLVSVGVGRLLRRCRSVGGGFSGAVVGVNSSFGRSGFAVARLLPPSGTISRRGVAVAVGISVVVGISVEGERASSLGDPIGHVGGWWKAMARMGCTGSVTRPGTGPQMISEYPRRRAARARTVVAFGCSLSMSKITSARKSTGGGGVASGEATPLGESRDILDDGGGDGISTAVGRRLIL